MDETLRYDDILECRGGGGGGAAAAALSPSGPRSMAVSGGALMTRSTPRLLTHALMSTSTLSIAALCCTKKACSFFFWTKGAKRRGKGRDLRTGVTGVIERASGGARTSSAGREVDAVRYLGRLALSFCRLWGEGGPVVRTGESKWAGERETARLCLVERVASKKHNGPAGDESQKILRVVLG